MERNYEHEYEGRKQFQRRMNPNLDRFSRWSEDDERMDRDERYAREDAEYERFNKYTRHAPYTTYSNINENHAYADRYRGQTYDLRDRDGFRSNASPYQQAQNYGRAPAFGYESTPYQNFGRSTNFSDQSRSSGYGPGGTYNYGGSPSGYAYQNQFGRDYDRSQGWGSSRYSRDFNPGYSGSQFGNQSNFGSDYGAGYSRFGNESFPASSRYDSPYRGQDSLSGSYASDWGRSNAYHEFQSVPWNPKTELHNSTNRSGRAPKGYKRSDERIKEEICDLLTSAPHIDPSDLEVKVSSGEVTLTGTIEDRLEKRMAEDLASTISGVVEVHNQLRVVGQSERSGYGRTSGSYSSNLSASTLTDSRSDSLKSNPGSSKSVQ